VKLHLVSVSVRLRLISARGLGEVDSKSNQS